MMRECCCFRFHRSRGLEIRQKKRFFFILEARSGSSHARSVRSKGFCFSATEQSSLLAKNHISVVSGLALGIDGFSHEGALSEGGRTYAFLGCGVDRCYPPSHEILLKRIIESGALMSEFPPGTKPLKNNFPVRNRLISGLSERVVIVEAGGKERFAYHCGFRAGAGKRDLCLSGKI